jgi:hypothetical protein
VADPGARAADAVDGGEVLLPRGAPLAVRWAEVASLARTVPAIVLAELDRARDPASTAPLPALEGELPADLPPAGWPLALAGASTAAPTAPADGRRIATAWALATFAITPARRDLRLIEVRARYRDGLAIWLNGVPVVRRGRAAGGSPLGLAPRPRGPEWETFYVPVVFGLLRDGENLLAVEARASARSPAASLELEVVGRRRRGWWSARWCSGLGRRRRRSSSRPTGRPGSRSAGAPTPAAPIAGRRPSPATAAATWPSSPTCRRTPASTTASPSTARRSPPPASPPRRGRAR